ncbi:arylsulfatase [Algoriphagus aquimarinus]|uniref:arylsulfatase n=1 Tax=Algoriphagus aquimarinus TaxID=237018 RepID=UPI0030D6DD59|tara:strand:+ start:16168 stop:17562 length:1395 start_codon:yes stop_codon:yes gene_type:complete
MKNYIILFVGICVFAVKSYAYQDPKNKSNKPNIIYILADDLGYGDLGCYGQSEVFTPNIDKLASEGMKFSRHYAGATVCAPSRNSLITGQHMGNTTIKSIEKPILAEDITVAEMLKTVGYQTAVIGKWGLGTVGTTGYANSQGFDYSFGYYDQIRAHNYYPDYLMENGERYPIGNKVIYVTDSSNYAVGIGSAAIEKNVYSNDLFTEKALDFIGEIAGEPFFLYLAYTIPHANNESFLINQHGMEVPNSGDYAEKDWPDAKKSGAAMISRLDSYVGQIMAKLKEKGLDDETLVIFTSDNGPHQEGGWKLNFFDSNGDLRGMKRDLYEGGIRVPFIARWQGKIGAGSTTDQPVAFWDFLPTACELAGVTAPTSTDGISYLPTLMGKSNMQRQHDYLYWEFDTSIKRQAIMKGDWKLVRIESSNPSTDVIELFDLSNDIGENVNLASKYPEKVNGFMHILEKYRDQ